MEEPQIAIVGAGPVGLAAALLLRRRGLAATIYERRSGVAELPQAHVVNTRTCEILREIGVYPALAEKASSPDRLAAITWRESVAGPCFGALSLRSDPQEWDRCVSPVHRLNVGQDVSGSVLLQACEEAGCEVLFNHAVTGASVEGGKAVLAVKDRDGGGRRAVFDYVLACDGAGSTVRDALGIAMEGPPSLARFASCYFKADLNRFFSENTGPVHFLGGSDVSGSLICFDMKETWALMCVVPPDAAREQFSEATMLELVRRAIGSPEVDVKLISIGAWNMSAQVAAQFRSGPFFLLGDAAHRFPPSGGLGLNTGVQDAHNLAWKLALVTTGAAPVALLDTYAAERQPMAKRNCDHSVRNIMNLMEVDMAVEVQFLSPVDPDVVRRPAATPRDHGIDGDTPEAKAKRGRIAKAIENQRPHFSALRVELGYRYGEGEWSQMTDYNAMPGVMAGARLPHAWIEDNGQRVSTLDLPNMSGYTLLIYFGADTGASLTDQLEQRSVSVRRVPGCVLFSKDRRAVLVRPDGHVLWCGAAPDETLFTTLDQLHAGEIPRDTKPVRVFTEKEEVTMTIATRQGIHPTKLAHIVLRTNERFEQMCEWYRSLLNAEYVHKDPMLAFMTYDEEHHRVAVARVPGMVDRPSGTVGLEHIAFTFASTSDLLETYARLKQNEIEPILTINHGATTSIYYEDPDRNRVEIQVDNFESMEGFNAFLRSGVMAVNPIGVVFDADEMLAKVRSGIPEETLKAYPTPSKPVDPKVMDILFRN